MECSTAFGAAMLIMASGLAFGLAIGLPILATAFLAKWEAR